ncbi:MAG: hypothetical protein M1835_002881 [Candelina submexicana]|nr:MAG: hypothetical protein M1835_002881 [Candelina submexicana]
MSVRIIARIRPLLKTELDKDIIVQAVPSDDDPSGKPTIVRIPNPRNGSEDFSFQFNSVYDQDTNQQDIFDNEISPTIKHLFNGFDVTLFAYGVTGTGKTHTMRGGKSLTERGVIPRLLSGIYRRSRKIEKDSQGKNTVEVSMSYYEIYNDRVFDLFEAPEKRTATGLQLRDNGGKTVVVGLTERPCSSLKEFEQSYDYANVNRSTSATKLNAHSSRSHAVLCVRVSITTSAKKEVSIVNAIDLAGSEDNRRTGNGKERLVESASINKSLFVLAQCVEAISKKQQRIPYRESKMTRILSLGQNNGFTLMILNLAPLRSYHLDTLSSLNFANRTKKIEVKEIENEPMFRGPPRVVAPATDHTLHRQPLRPLAAAHNTIINGAGNIAKSCNKQTKEFSVYSDRTKARLSATANQIRKAEPVKRGSDCFNASASRPAKALRPSDPSRCGRAQPEMSMAGIEEMVEKKVEEILAARALNESTKLVTEGISEQVQRRLELLEQKIENKEDARAEGLTYLLMASKFTHMLLSMHSRFSDEAEQHHVRGEETSALKMYQLASPYFPDNEKLASKIASLQGKLKEKREQQSKPASTTLQRPPLDPIAIPMMRKTSDDPADDDYETSLNASSDGEYQDDDGLSFKPKVRKPSKTKVSVFRDGDDELGLPSDGTPRTRNLLRIINTRDLSQIKLLKGVGVKKAEAIVDCLCNLEDGKGGKDGGTAVITSLGQLSSMKGVGAKTVESMRFGLSA